MTLPTSATVSSSEKFISAQIICTSLFFFINHHDETQIVGVTNLAICKLDHSESLTVSIHQQITNLALSVFLFITGNFI